MTQLHLVKSRWRLRCYCQNFTVASSHMTEVPGTRTCTLNDLTGALTHTLIHISQAASHLSCCVLLTLLKTAHIPTPVSISLLCALSLTLHLKTTLNDTDTQTFGTHAITRSCLHTVQQSTSTQTETHLRMIHSSQSLESYNK